MAKIRAVEQGRSRGAPRAREVARAIRPNLKSREARGVVRPEES